MKVENGKILEGTESEIFQHWLNNWDDIMDFYTYKIRLIRLGVKIIDNK